MINYLIPLVAGGLGAGATIIINYVRGKKEEGEESEKTNKNDERIDELESCVKDINERIAKIEGRLEEIHK